MRLTSLRATGSVYLIALVVATLWSGRAHAQLPDSLTLRAPTGVFVVPEMESDRQRFTNYIFWQNIPDSIGKYVHPADTAGWNPSTSNTPNSALSVPSSSGFYSGTIDRTIRFQALNSGIVGTTPSIRLRYTIIAEEDWFGIINAGSAYSAGTPIPCNFTQEVTGAQRNLGLNVTFTPGRIDSNGVFVVGLEDFEGFHIWRGIAADGSDLTVTGELSKEEEFAGSPVDFLYYNAIIPALRATGRFDFGFEVPGLGSSIDITNIHPNGKLGPREFAWFDTNAFNGFTYQYTVTTFDRGYNVRSTQQGLVKVSSCPVITGMPYACQSELVPVTTTVTPQNVMREIYAVPNPYRTGSTQFSAPNYHNYPDNKVRFVNMPADCELRIYSVAGDLVQTLFNRGGSGVVEWDARNRGGQDVSSGVYIFRVEKNTGESMYGRLIVIR